MWPPDPDPDPEPAASSRPGPAVPGLRALLPARAFLCSLKGLVFVCTWCSCSRHAL
uniref:CKLF like MARVEL transmembrane domain containing 3 n=1 Tax=Microcebus murinus TaxID=30608 RepID=A0A8C5Y456_MICMU